MKADGLTKNDQKLRDEFISWLMDPWAILHEEGVKDQKKKTSEKHVAFVSSEPLVLHHSGHMPSAAILSQDPEPCDSSRVRDAM